MYNIYKVTEARIEKLSNGDERYFLQLDGYILATKLVPSRELWYDRLHKQYIENNKSLDFLLGRHIAIIINNSETRPTFNHVISLDALQDFKRSIDKSKGKPFFTNIDIFSFLERRNYPKNQDGSITLRKAYSEFNVAIKDDSVICYRNKNEENTLTFDNIEIIYNQFFKGKTIENGDPDRDERYAITPVSIVIHRRIFHKDRSDVISDDYFDIMSIGEKLPAEYSLFLSSLDESRDQSATSTGKTLG